MTAIAAALLGFFYVKRAPEQARIIRTIRTSIKPATNLSFGFSGNPAVFAVSPDGRRLAYVASAADGKTFLWVRAIDSLEAQPLVATEGSSFLFWSPDSNFIGFFASGKLKKIEA